MSLEHEDGAGEDRGESYSYRPSWWGRLKGRLLSRGRSSAEDQQASS